MSLSGFLVGCLVLCLVAASLGCIREVPKPDVLIHRGVLINYEFAPDAWGSDAHVFYFNDTVVRIETNCFKNISVPLGVVVEIWKPVRASYYLRVVSE